MEVETPLLPNGYKALESFVGSATLRVRKYQSLIGHSYTTCLLYGLHCSCSHILDGKNFYREDWKPVLTINSIIYGLQFLFLEPNPEDPLNKGTWVDNN